MTFVLFVIALCMLMEGLFSGAETGFYSVNRLRLRSRVEAGSRRAIVLQHLLDRPDETMMTTLIGTNVMVYATSALATELLSSHRHAEFLATLILTPLLFVFGEMIPKDLFHRRADSLMYPLAAPVNALRILAWPVTAVLRRLVAALTAGRLAREHRPLFSRAQLREWIAEGRHEGVLSDYQHALTANVMGLLKKRVASVMIPIDAVAMFPADLAGEGLRSAIREAGHARYPVYHGARENVVGILHTLDYICSAEDRPAARRLAREKTEVRQSDGISAALVALQTERRQMAVVVDDAGRAAGVVTVKDLVEEIVGELEAF